MRYVTVGKENSKDIEIYYKDWGKNAQSKVYKGGAHGMCTTQKDEVNADLLAFFKS